jgi:hypothetical protein
LFKFVRTKCEMKKLTLLCAFMIVAGELFAQNALSFRIIGLTAHPWANINLPLHRNALDSKGYLTFEPGLIISYDRHLKKKFSANITTAILNDRFNYLAGFSQIMVKYNVLKYYKHSLNLGFGPAVHYEADKRTLDGYADEDHLYYIGDTGYKISWISGMLEYNYFWSKEFGLSLCLNQIHPRSIGLSVGLRFDIPDPNGKGCNCPSFR